MMEVSFSLEQVIALATLAAIIIGAIWALYRSLNKRVDDQTEDLRKAIGEVTTNIDKKFELADTKRDAARGEQTAQHERLRGEMVERGRELHQRIDEVRNEYVRREDIAHLTHALNTLSGRLDAVLTTLAARTPVA